MNAPPAGPAGRDRVYSFTLAPAFLFNSLPAHVALR